MISRLGGEFFLEWNGCKARDHFGIMPGDCPPGAVVCGDEVTGKIDPKNPVMNLGEAIEIAVRLRSDEGVVAMSGGVDSALVARLAGRECVVVGIEGSHDLHHATQVAENLGLALSRVLIDPNSIEDRLRQVLSVIPKIDPVNASIATTLNYVSEWAGQHGHRRILAGQGADELFGGYARYLQTETLAQDLEKDFLGLSLQLTRDQAVAGLHDTYFSLPYMDVRVVAAALSIPPEQKVCEWCAQEAAAGGGREVHAHRNCPAREKGHAIWQRRDEGDTEAGEPEGIQEIGAGLLAIPVQRSWSRDRIADSRWSIKGLLASIE